MFYASDTFALIQSVIFPIIELILHDAKALPKGLWARTLPCLPWKNCLWRKGTSWKLTSAEKFGAESLVFSAKLRIDYDMQFEGVSSKLRNFSVSSWLWIECMDLKSIMLQNDWAFAFSFLANFFSFHV